MRKDMNKVIVERPRIGGVGKENTRLNRHETKQTLGHMDDVDEVDVVSFHAMKRLHTQKPNSWDDKKQLNENLAPLHRFLQSRVGQPWNKVYSEIMQNLNLNNSVQYHVYQHLTRDRMVETNTYMSKSGKIVAQTPYGPRVIESGYSPTFYVDPRDGTLQNMPNINRRSFYETPEVARKSNHYYDPTDLMIQYHKIDGIWYEYKMRTATDEERKKKDFGQTISWYDPWARQWTKKWYREQNKFYAQMLTKKDEYVFSDMWYGAKHIFGDYLMPISKRQLGSKDVKRLEAKIAASCEKHRK